MDMNDPLRARMAQELGNLLLLNVELAENFTRTLAHRDELLKQNRLLAQENSDFREKVAALEDKLNHFTE